MEENFKTLLEVKGIKGVLLFSADGQVIYENIIADSTKTAISDQDWVALLEELKGINEADMTFENRRIYCKKSKNCVILVFFDKNTSAATVRLNCDIILSLDLLPKQAKGIKRFFSRKK